MRTRQSETVSPSQQWKSLRRVRPESSPSTRRDVHTGIKNKKKRKKAEKFDQVFVAKRLVGAGLSYRCYKKKKLVVDVRAKDDLELYYKTIPDYFEQDDGRKLTEIPDRTSTDMIEGRY